MVTLSKQRFTYEFSVKENVRMCSLIRCINCPKRKYHEAVINYGAKTFRTPRECPKIAVDNPKTLFSTQRSPRAYCGETGEPLLSSALGILQTYVLKQSKWYKATGAMYFSLIFLIRQGQQSVGPHTTPITTFVVRQQRMLTEESAFPLVT